MLSSGHVHPETPGLIDRLLLSVTDSLGRVGGLTAAEDAGTHPSSAVLSADGPFSLVPCELLLLDELCRSKRVAARLVRNTAVAQARFEYLDNDDNCRNTPSPPFIHFI